MIQELMEGGDLYHALDNPQQESELRWSNRCWFLFLCSEPTHAPASACASQETEVVIVDQQQPALMPCSSSAPSHTATRVDGAVKLLSVNDWMHPHICILESRPQT